MRSRTVLYRIVRLAGNRAGRGKRARIGQLSVALAAIFTGIGIYDKLGRFAGAGSTIPITGFSNAVVAPALEFRCEGMIYGLGAKMFLVAGPVVVNGVAVSIVIALITLIVGGF